VPGAGPGLRRGLQRPRPRRRLATAIHTTGDDYRYAHREEGGETNLSSYALPEDIAQASVALAAALGLDFAGIDLKIAPDGAIYCFEVNPSPAYSYYESHTDQLSLTASATGREMKPPDGSGSRRTAQC
jgi:hypothetical protein